jgi:exonuclease III
MTPINLMISLLLLFYGCAENTLIPEKSLLNACDYIIDTFDPINLTTSIFNTDSTLDIITWNLEHFPKNNLLTIDSLVTIIKHLNPDIIAMQEIKNQNYFDQLISHLDGWSGERTNGDYALAYIYKSELIVNDIYEISELDDYSLTRTPMMLELTWKNEDYYIINNHYKCCGDGIISSTDTTDEEYRRLQSVRLTKGYIDVYYNHNNVVILGDFNDELDDDIVNNIFIDFILDNTNYRFVDLFINCSYFSYWSYPSWPSHLDHILITNELFDNVQHAQTIIAEDYFLGGWTDYDDVISDHRPVGIRLKMEN